MRGPCHVVRLAVPGPRGAAPSSGIRVDKQRPIATHRPSFFCFAEGWGLHAFVVFCALGLGLHGFGGGSAWYVAQMRLELGLWWLR